MKETIAISRVTFSGRLTAILVPDSSDRDSFPGLCRLLAGQGINIAFAAMQAGFQGRSGICCISHTEQPRAQAVLDRHRTLRPALVFLPDKALVGLFPHQHRFEVLAKSMQALGSEHIKIYGQASSISALTFVVDFDRAGHAVQVLGRFFELPAGYDGSET